MDARPQRVRVRGDENALPVGVLPGKTIHQRNKSTPALSALAQNGGIRNNAKRTAFGDVSNTANHPIRASKDDAHVPGKNIPLAKNRANPQEKKGLVLSQPAQRPASVIGMRSTNESALQKTDASTHGTTNVRKLPVKKSNAVFKDPLPSVAENVPASSRTTAPSAVDNDAAKPEERRTSSSDAKTKIESSAAAASKPTQARDQRGVPDAEKEKKDDERKVLPGSYPVPSSDTVTLDEDEESDSGRYASVKPRDSLELAHARSDHEEEYWDEEDDEDEDEEDDGCNTLRSIRSRGDNTTGGATTVLFPKYNQKVKRELARAKKIVESLRAQGEIDDDLWDPCMAAEYSDEIFEHLRATELKMLPNAHYMDNQAEIQWSMRSVLMDWLVQVHNRFSLLPETLFLCVNCIDRFLSCKIVSLGKLQLVGATAIFIAAKYEEINCPSIQEIVYMVDGGYTVEEILKAERFMLSMLGFELGWPGPMSFLRRISKADDYDDETRTLAKYFLEVTIMDERFVSSPPSFTAAGAHCLARLMLRKGDWSVAHVYYSNYTYSQLYPLMSVMLECCENPMKHHSAIYEKYADRRFKRASLFAEAEISKGFRLPRP
ncbi:hypothetical protein VTN31DRAFT_6356 [Thermomyces dupontii]|uniref:uncharacterized protein n=1 Tax=Talaromyces thermophilus TaxID=28565 RepID=UPI003741F326